MKPSEKLLQTIRERDIKPVPKGYFILKNALLWTGFAVAMLLGAVAFSVILFCIQQTEFDLVSHLSHSRLEFFLGLLPFSGSFPDSFSGCGDDQFQTLPERVQSGNRTFGGLLRGAEHFAGYPVLSGRGRAGTRTGFWRPGRFI
ncbi:MAG: hypothetical protein IPM81_11920 [Saprospirales bacterium]|nr:hypothetical protein [Saprospirales bacterium]